MTQSAIPGINAINETFDFVRKMWGGVGVPGMTVPTMSVDEINKKIAELKAVEAWLNINTSMLRSTIQALEVQSATLSAVQSIGAAMGAAMKPGGQEKPPFASMFSGSTAGFPGTQPGGFSFPGWDMNPSGAAADNRSATSQASSPSAASTNAADDHAAPAMDFGNAFAAPTAWWNMLQTQFAQAVSSAMSESAKDDETSPHVSVDASAKVDKSTREKEGPSNPSAGDDHGISDQASQIPPKKRKSS